MLKSTPTAEVTLSTAMATQYKNIVSFLSSGLLIHVVDFFCCWLVLGNNNGLFKLEFMDFKS